MIEVEGMRRGESTRMLTFIMSTSLFSWIVLEVPLRLEAPFLGLILVAVDIVKTSKYDGKANPERRWIFGH